MSTKWTIDQQKAIDIRNSDALVSAAAGSGKTAVLVERVINMITDEENPVYINNLLIATFTNAAAAEMRERIYTALRNKINETPDNKFLNEQLVLLGQAQISTIHSFCINLLRENFHMLGIRHDFEIADEVKTSAMIESAIEEVLDKHYEEMDADFLNTVDAFGGKKSDDNLIKIILQLNKFADSLAYPERWLDKCMLMQNDIGIYKECALGNIRGKLEHIVTLYRNSVSRMNYDEGLASYYEIYSGELDMFEAILSNFDDRQRASAAFANVNFKTLAGKRTKNAMEENVAYVKAARSYAKENIDELRNMYLYSDDDIREDMEIMSPYIKTICNLVLEVRRLYSEMKLKENIMEFSDLEHYTIKLLDENEDICNEIRAKYTEIFVDEYQDTNGVQAKLFELISNGNNLFMVGDVKQSIYGFRNSDPQFFIGKYNEFGFEQNDCGTKILLSQNFRSSNGVLAFVNNIFENMMSQSVGGVDYNDEHRLIYGNTSVKNIDVSAETHIINTKFVEDSSLTDEDKMLDKTHLEAIFVANRIIDIVEREKPEIYDKKTDSYRSVTYSDIAVLMRNTKNTASVFADVFAQRGIPVYTEEKGEYFNSIEIATVMSFLKIIQNPLQNVPMLAVMRSPMFGFSDELIAKLRSADRYADLYSLLKSSDDEKARSFTDRLDELSELARYNDVEYIVRKIIFDTGYYYFAGGLPDGEKRMMNLRLLCDRANEFSKSGYKGIMRFIRYVEEMLGYGNGYSSAKIISKNDNVVTIMTVHKSKGLEFPIVFLSNCGTSFNKRDLSNPCIYDSKLGIATDIVDKKRRLKYVPYIKKVIADKKNDELISEEVRLLYVALTRAKYKIIVTSAINKAAETFEMLNSKDCVPYTFKSEKSYIEWISNILNPNMVSLHTAEEVIEADKECVVDNIYQDMEADYSEFAEKIDDILSFEYKYADSKKIPSKKSISEIVSSSDDKVRLSSIRQKADGLTSAQRGTVIHYVLQNINLNDVSTADSIENQIKKMIDDGMLEEDYANIIDVEAIYGFFCSDIGRRMLKSDNIYREFKFCVDVPSDEIGYEIKEEKVLIQGVIDCCFIENDEFVIIDYKTGSLQEKYNKQLELYRRCLEIATGKIVKETQIYPLV